MTKSGQLGCTVAEKKPGLGAWRREKEWVGKTERLAKVPCELTSVRKRRNSVPQLERKCLRGKVKVTFRWQCGGGGTTKKVATR